MNRSSVIAWLALWPLIMASSGHAQPLSSTGSPVEAPVGCGGLCVSDVVATPSPTACGDLCVVTMARAQETPVGCPGGLCLTARVAPPSEVGCGGFCANSEYSQNVATFGFPLKLAGAAESLGTAVPEAPETPAGAPAFAAGLADLKSFAARIDNDRRICTTRAGAPISVWREALVQRPALLACDRAARPLLEQREDNAEAYFAFLSGAVTRQASTFKELFRAYKEACLQPIEQYESVNAFRSLFGTEFSARVRDNVGTLVGRTGSYRYQCTATIVRLSEEPKAIGLLTAAHCVGATRSMGIDSNQIESVAGALLFTSLSGHQMAVRINEDVRGWIYPLRHDLAIVPATTDITKQVEGLPIGNPSTLNGWDPLYLIGINPILMALAMADNASTAEIMPIQATTITLSTPCRVIGLDRGRLVHNCETEKQMSGSPVFAMINGSPAIVAVHTGGDNAPSPLAACGSSSWPAINQAVIVPFN